MSYDEATVARFEAHREFTDSVLKRAWAEDRAGEHERAYGIVWALRDVVLLKARGL